MQLNALALALVAILVAPARAQDHATAAIFVHADDDQLTVVHPSASARATVDRTAITARYDADVITSATIDVRTSASVRPFEETRHGLGLEGETSLSRAVAARAALAPEQDDLARNQCAVAFDPEAAQPHPGRCNAG